MLRIVIPAAGAGSRFNKENWKRPKPFIRINGTNMVDLVAKNFYEDGSIVTPIFQEAHKCYVSFEDKKAVFVNGLTDGTACTVLEALKYAPVNDELLIVNSDQLVSFDPQKFYADARDKCLDGSILTFIDKDEDPKWSFAKIDDTGYVTEVAEKKVISKYATVGAYYFRRVRDFIESAQTMIQANDRVNGEFYVCPVYNYMIEQRKRIGIYNIEFENMHGLGTPRDLKYYLCMNGLSSEDSPD